LRNTHYIIQIAARHCVMAGSCYFRG